MFVQCVFERDKETPRGFVCVSFDNSKSDIALIRPPLMHNITQRFHSRCRKSVCMCPEFQTNVVLSAKTGCEIFLVWWEGNIKVCKIRTVRGHAVYIPQCNAVVTSTRQPCRYSNNAFNLSGSKRLLLAWCTKVIAHAGRGEVDNTVIRLYRSIPRPCISRYRGHDTILQCTLNNELRRINYNSCSLYFST